MMWVDEARLTIRFAFKNLINLRKGELRECEPRSIAAMGIQRLGATNIFEWKLVVQLSGVNNQFLVVFPFRS
jgi:hypothetical protein